jgi:hypothetical protein
MPKRTAKLALSTGILQISIKLAQNDCHRIKRHNSAGRQKSQRETILFAPKGINETKQNGKSRWKL